MKKVNFKELVIADIEGKEQKIDISKLLGNQLYMEGQDIEACELGKRIYFADGDVELTDKEATIVKQAMQRYSYLVRTAVETILKDE